MFRPTHPGLEFVFLFGEGGLKERAFFSVSLSHFNFCFVSQCSCYGFSALWPWRRGQLPPHWPPPPLDTPPTSSPHVCPCIWEVKHVCDITRTTRNADGMEWSQPQPRRAPSSDGEGGEEGRKGGGGTEGGERGGTGEEKQQAGMKVRKPSLVKKKRANWTKNG